MSTLNPALQQQTDLIIDLLKAIFIASPKRKMDALEVLKGWATVAEPVVVKPITGPMLLGMGAAAKYLGVSRTILWRMAKNGRIEKVEILPGSYRIRRTDLEDIVSGKRPC